MRKALILALLCTPLLYWGALPASQAAAQDQSFRAFLQTWEQAQTRFINGDPTLWKQHASHRDDVTILGGFGGEGEKGGKAVGARYDWASSQYRAGNATVKVDYHSIVVSGDLALYRRCRAAARRSRRQSARGRQASPQSYADLPKGGGRLEARTPPRRSDD